jgi:choline dehydrogenase
MLAMTGAPIQAFVCSREGLEAIDLMLGWIPMLTEPSPRGRRILRQSGLTLYALAMRPESKGHVHIAAADARRPPAINFNFLSSAPDAHGPHHPRDHEGATNSPPPLTSAAG